MQENRKNIKLILVILFCALFSILGCSKEKLDPLNYRIWVKNEENGLNRAKKVGDYTIRVQYKPIDFVILSELGSKGKYDSKTIEAKKEDLKGMQYYDLYLGNVGGDFIKSQSSSEKDLYDRIYYYSFSFANDIKLIDGKDTLNCDLFHFEKDYDLGKEKRFLLGFENLSENENDKIIYIDSKAIGLAIIKIQIKNKDIKNTPLVQYETKN